MNLKLKYTILFAALLSVTVFFRICLSGISSPLMLIALILPKYLSKYNGTIFMVALLLLVDLLTMLFTDYGTYGLWTWFTYSGFMLIYVISNLFLYNKNKPINLILNLIIITTLYWLWVNFGTWLTSQMYLHNLSGIKKCFMMALPFLKKHLYSNLFWLIIYNLCKSFIKLKSLLLAYLVPPTRINHLVL